MEPSRHLSSGILLALVCFFTASARPLIAQPVISIEHDPYVQLDRLESPWGLSDDLLDRLARRAAEYEEAAAGFECHETTRRVKYPPSGRANASHAREATYWLALQDGSMTPSRGRSKSLKRYGKSAAPPVHAWTQLFAPRNQPYFAYRDVGEVQHAFGKARKIQFRGAVPYSGGADIREWEGTVLVDSYSLLPLELDAQPLHLWPRLEHQWRRYIESFKFVFFGLVIRFKQKPIAERVHVRFDMQENGMTLPVDAHVEKIEKTSADQAVVHSRLVASYEHRFPDGLP